MTALAASFRSSWVALRRPSVLLTSVLAAGGFAALATTIAFTAATQTASDGPAAGPQLPTIADLEQASGIVYGLVQGTTFLGIIAVVLGAFAVASDYQHGTLRTLLVRQPRRLVLLGGKAIGVCVVVIGTAAVATLVSAGLALALAGGQGVDTAAWSAGEALAGLGQIAVAMLGYAFLGGVLGLVLRSQVAAIGAGVAWILAIEQILSGAIDGARDVLPGQLLAAIADGTISTVGVATISAYLLVAAAVCGRMFARRDVAA